MGRSRSRSKSKSLIYNNLGQLLAQGYKATITTTSTAPPNTGNFNRTATVFPSVKKKRIRKKPVKGQGIKHKTKRTPIGKLKYYTTLPFYGGRVGRKYVSAAHAAEKYIKNGMTFNHLRWFLKIKEYDGAVIPPIHTMFKLIGKGYVKLQITEEGEKYLEDEGQGKLMLEALNKSKIKL